MKNNLKLMLIVITTLSLTGCGKNDDSNTSVIAEQHSSFETVEESTESIESSETVESSTSQINYEEEKFVSVSELYLHVEESYSIDKMVNLGVSFKDIIVSSSNENVSINNNVIEGASLGDSEIYLTRENKRQTITCHVVSMDEYGSYLTSVDKGRLFNKNVIFFGDSITHNWAKYPNGDNLTVNNTDSLGYNYIPKLDAECDFASITNAAWSGGTMAALPKSNERFIYKSFGYCAENNEEAIKNADYAFVWYGTNDYTDQVSIGTIEDQPLTADSESTFKGGMNYGLSKILEYNPNISIILFNLLYRTYPANGTRIPLSSYNQAIDDMSKAYLCKMIDMYSLFTPTEFATYSNDGLHPNDLGYNLITKYILNNGVK